MSWNKVKFKKCITLQRGFDLPASEMKGGEIPVLGSTGIIGYHNEAKVNSPGVVTGRSGTIGLVQYADEPYWPHNTSLWVKDFKANNPKFVYYKLQTLRLNRFSGGASVPTLNRNNLDNLLVQIPDIPTQEKTASILSTYDDLIENNHRRIQLSEETTRLLYREWFVYFRFPGHEEVKIVDGVPKGWEKKKIDKVLTLEYGKSLVADKREEGEIPVYGSSGIIGFHNRALVKGPGIVVGRAGNAGSVHWENKDFFPVDSTFYVKTKVNDFLLYFYYYLSICRLERFISGSAVPGLNRNIVHSSMILIPKKDIVDKFNNFAYQIIRQCSHLNTQNQKLSQARDLLLSRLMSGAIEVSGFDIETPQEAET